MGFDHDPLWKVSLIDESVDVWTIEDMVRLREPKSILDSRGMHRDK